MNIQWVIYPNGGSEATIMNGLLILQTSVGCYDGVYKYCGCIRGRYVGRIYGPFDTREEAQKAAENDFRRLLKGVIS